jgi:hypothetical protein
VAKAGPSSQAFASQAHFIHVYAMSLRVLLGLGLLAGLAQAIVVGIDMGNENMKVSAR